ncbi:MAG TPA: histidine kinase [Thermoleophilaceae bacterium]|nr:histidine kinase [Thermoleophilaceae bacterium]
MRTREPIDRYGDALFAGLTAALFVVQIASEDHFAGKRGAALAAALVFSATLVWRRRQPLVPLFAGTALIEFSNLVVPALGNTGTFFLAYVVVLYSAGRFTAGRATLVAALTLVVAFPLAAIEPGQAFSLSDAVFIAVAFAGPFVAGVVIRRRHETESELHGRAAQLERERDAKAREAVTQERVRIARELHDVVAHAISVMVLQARGGRRKLPDGADETRTALDAIESAGEQALAEMRRLLGMLRFDDEEIALAPQPSLSRIDELVASLGAASMPVEVRIEGKPVELPPGVDVSAFRIVQEALTNALKHAGPARARVTVRYTPDDLELEIVDDGRGNGHGGGTGQGLVGIRERVAVYGGDVESGRRPEGGYALRARLPLGSSR